MFHTGLWFKNSEEEEYILQSKLSELTEQKKLLQNDLSSKRNCKLRELIEQKKLSQKDLSAVDEEYVKKRKKMEELSAKVVILKTALKQMQFSLNSNHNLAPNIEQEQQLLTVPPLVPPSAMYQQMETNNAIQRALQQLMTTTKGEGQRPSKQTLASALPSMAISTLTSPRIQSSNYDLNHFEISCLNERYEKEVDILRKRSEKVQHRTGVNHRIYHIEPDLSEEKRYKKTDEQKLEEDENGFFTEHIWKETIDEALEQYIDGDILQLAEGRHVVSGKHIIYDRGIVRISLRSQFIGKKVIFHCNTLEGICIEHSSKLWLDECVILNSVGAAIHINTGCKCLLTQTSIVNCGEGDHEIAHGQGAIVIYGSDINYAEHLIRQTPSLRFPSMDNVPPMVLDPDPTLAAMLRGRTYLYVQECKIKSNCGFGIAFEVPKNFHPLPVAVIATMMDISITVRETHFTENSFGNMGKIPAVWIEHANKDGLFLNIKRINPELFGHVIVEDLSAMTEEMKTNNDAEEEENENETSKEGKVIFPLIKLVEQDLRAHGASMSDRYDSDNGSVQIIEPPSSRRSKSEIEVSAVSNQQTQNGVDVSTQTQNGVDNPIVIEEDETEVSIKVSEQKEGVETQPEGKQILPIDQKIVHQVEVKSSEDQKDPNQNNMSEVSPFKRRDYTKDVESDISKGLMALDGNTNLKESEVENDGNKEESLRRSSRIKVKQETKESNDDDLPHILPNQPKTKKAVTKKIKSQSPSPSTTKTKKRRRVSNRKKAKQHKPNSNDIDDDKENEKLSENPRKRRKLNESVGAKNAKFVSNECKENESEKLERMVEEDEADSDVAINDKEVVTPKKRELRRSTRKASIRATKNLLKEKNVKRNSHQKKKKEVLSQKITSNNTRNKKARRKRRNSTNSKRA